MRIICETCKKEVIGERGVTPPEWFRLETIRMGFRTKEGVDILPNKNVFFLDEDPPFCSLSCFLAWIELNARKIMKK